MNDGMNDLTRDLQDFFGSVGTGLLCLIGPPVLIVLLIGIPLEIFLDWPPWAAALPGAVLVYSGGFLVYWEQFSHRAQKSRRVEGYNEHLRSEVASLGVQLKEAEERASDDYEGRLVTDGGVRQPNGAYLLPDGRLVTPKNPKAHPIPTPREHEVYEPHGSSSPYTGPRVRLEEFRDIIESEDGSRLYVDGFYEVKDEENGEQEDKSQEWMISIPIPPPQKADE